LRRLKKLLNSRRERSTVYEIKVPEIGFSVKEATVLEWTKNIGEMVQEDKTVVIVETDKVAVEIPALAAGVLTEIRFKKGEIALVGDVLGLIADEAEAGAVAAQEFSAVTKEVTETVGLSATDEMMAAKKATVGMNAKPTAAKRKISPVARKIARRENVDLSEITVGSGPGGRVTKEDVLKFVSKKKSGEVETREISQEADPPQKILFVGWRKVIADRMVSSARVPQGRTVVEVDVTELAGLIRSLKEQGDGPHVTYLPFLMKAIQAGIEIIPEINAYCFDDGFVLQKNLNIGVAVDVDEKLIVPVVKKVRDKSILVLAEEIETLARKARNNSLKPEDVQGGTITITNLGPYDVYTAMPLILQPQTTIVAMGTVREQPGVVNGSIEIRKKVMVTGVFDHRAVNGAPGARFLKKVKSHLENLSNMILGLR
jgi:pyruvate/2-oxoglutarate dehydrogenase complex dihydrolipoamide acyltransferase (E2) component